MKFTTRMLWLAAGLGLGLGIWCHPAGAEQPSPPSSAASFVAGLYAHYTSLQIGAAPGADLQDAAALGRVFTPDLVKLILADRSDADNQGLPPRLDADPLVDAQDWQIENLAATVAASDPTQAIAVVTFTNAARWQRITLSLRHLPQGWLVSDIAYTDTDLRSILAGGR